MSSEQSTAQSSNTVPAAQLQTITVPEGQRYIARVKWFDNALSYGFATVTSGEHAGRDIFVHQSNILTLSQGIYRTLRMGEYIEFNIEESTENNHKYQAIAVTGPGAGQLMCESNPRRPRVFQTRNDTSAANGAQQQQTTNGGDGNQVRQSRQRRSYQQRGFHGQAPIQVVVEYPNPPRQQRRPRQHRQNQQHNHSATASAAANIAATLSAGN